uniref:Uncharacterized protein n=1 Tax=Peronospora matthiolae TaxID=2874970 RepID=A0AAV1T7S5_9STRA
MSENEDKIAEDDMFIRWVHGVRRLSSMHALRESAGVADIRVKRKLRYDFTKLKARGRLWGQPRSRYASAASAATSSRRSFDTISPALTTTNEKRVLVKTISAVALKNVNDIVSDYDNDVVGVTAPLGAVSSLAYQATPVAVGVSDKSHDELVKKVEDFREILGQTQNTLGEARSRLATLEGDRARLQMMESRQARVEAQLDLLIRMQHPVATPMYAAQAPSSQHGTGAGMD